MEDEHEPKECWSARYHGRQWECFYCSNVANVLCFHKKMCRNEECDQFKCILQNKMETLHKLFVTSRIRKQTPICLVCLMARYDILNKPIWHEYSDDKLRLDCSLGVSLLNISKKLPTYRNAKKAPR